MVDSTDTKVGSMIFGSFFENGTLVSRDTSQFDDGSVYETAAFVFDTSTFQMTEVRIDLKTPQAVLDVDLARQDGKTSGTYTIIRDTLRTTYPIDSVYRHDIFRSELYMLLQSLQLAPGDTLSFQALAPTSMALSQASLYRLENETMETVLGTKECEVYMLQTDGKMPINKIWVTQDSPRTMVKFYVPGPELELVLKEQG